MSIFTQWPAYRQLMRIDKPIGTYLLLWPTLWALWLAAEGFPRWDVLLIFVAGVVLMRAAGCVINDYADRHVDVHIQRTQSRPLTTGEISEKSALALFAGLCLGAFGLVLLTNKLTIQLSLLGVGLVIAYPFMKRVTHLPQLVLGLAFSWAIPMAFAAQASSITSTAWFVFATVVLITVAYDTYYAMVDRDDDLRIGVKSTAILFGRWDRSIIALLQTSAVVLLLFVGHIETLGTSYYIGLAVMACLFVYQHWITRNGNRAACFNAFLNNHWASLAVWLGLVVNYL